MAKKDGKRNLISIPGLPLTPLKSESVTNGSQEKQDKGKPSKKYKERRGPRTFVPTSKEVDEWITKRAADEGIPKSYVAAHLLYVGYTIEREKPYKKEEAPKDTQ